MSKEELEKIKETAMQYGDPLRGKLLACVTEIERLNKMLEIAKCGYNDGM